MIIEVNGGEHEPLETMRRSVLRQELRHPVLWDQRCRNYRNYGLRNWPVACLIGPDGKVFWEGNPARVVNRPDQLRAFKNVVEQQLKGVTEEAKPPVIDRRSEGDSQ